MFKKGKEVKRGFTIIESFVVLFIIGILSITASLGFKRANEERAVEQGARKILAETSKIRDYAFTSKEIIELQTDPTPDESYFPCGYALSIKKSETEDQSLFLSYTNAADFQKLAVMEKAGTTCDSEILNSSGVSLKKISNEDSLDATSLNLGRATVTNIKGVQDSDSGVPVAIKDYQTLTILFSSPRSGAYYCTDVDAGGSTTIPPVSCDFKVFSEDKDTGNENYFEITLKTNVSSRKATIFPSGNVKIEYLATQ